MDPGRKTQIEYRECDLKDTKDFLKANHYLGPSRAGKICFAQYVDDEMVALQIWKHPSSRNLPSDGSWLELCRWCITPEAGTNAGSRQHKQVVKALKIKYPNVTTLVSYSDPAQGHTGALYASCNWMWAPTWHRLRPPPTGNGSWGKDGEVKTVKDRWIFAIKNDINRDEVLRVKDGAGQRTLDKLVALKNDGFDLRRI